VVSGEEKPQDDHKRSEATDNISSGLSYSIFPNNRKEGIGGLPADALPGTWTSDTIGMSIVPEQTALMRVPRSAYSSATLHAVLGAMVGRDPRAAQCRRSSS
jgi:hypothetical protein